jgi:thioesterase domain-containing protein
MHSVAPHGTAGLPLLPTIEAMALDYLERIRAVQPRGPYRLGGFCASGLVAYELARLMHAQGDVIEDVLLVNASALPQRAVPGLDALVRAIGLDVGLAPDLREALIYNVARLHAALATGPRATVSFIADRLGVPGTRASKKVTPRRSELEAFPKRGGTAETENSFVHLVASLTYHPEPYDGRVTLIWGMERKLRSSDPTVGWGALARDVRVVPMDVGHVTVLHEDVEQLGNVLEGLLRE